MRKIIVVDDEPITRMDICEILREANYDVVAEAGDGFDAIEQSKKYNPDFVIMDVKMPILDGLKAAKVITEQKLSRGIVLLTAYSNKEFIEEAKNIGIIGYIVKPIDEKSFIPNLEIIFNKQEEFEKLEKKYLKTSQKLEDRKKIDIAKSILMKTRNFTENEAYEYIRTLSMNKRCDMGKIADIIILSGDEDA
ncbi:response regulator receiver and ANTAR domain-containing protein [Leptotrichia hofstadii]|jgi:response regulator|uniref:Response regulator receiver domain protein n=2 Tax=Leptotrichia hofstadii TaxID=157688 RepID=C9MZN2_9FUSO|nr:MULTISPECIES: response regulator [Leptotrichia]EEX73859.1 response regulator receiver domain protein [Leptotrichia hofstadii F0254]BBM39701.1 response regulator receiver and ANTAR domain-containing protein [Leptotrichia hofstadii]